MKITIFFLLSLTAFSSFANEPSEPENTGKTLLQEKCTSCHGSKVYTRKDHKVTNLKALGAQVRRCKNNLGIEWFDDEVNEVINHLNTTHYHF